MEEKYTTAEADLAGSGVLLQRGARQTQGRIADVRIGKRVRPGNAGQKGTIGSLPHTLSILALRNLLADTAPSTATPAERMTGPLGGEGGRR